MTLLKELIVKLKSSTELNLTSYKVGLTLSFYGKKKKNFKTMLTIIRYSQFISVFSYNDFTALGLDKKLFSSLADPKLGFKKINLPK